MKKMLAVAVTVAISICMGQYLEKTIWLYDSFPTLGEPYVALHNPITNRMYIAGWQDIQVYDAGLMQKHAFLGYQAEWVAASRCPNVNRIYFSADDSVLAAFDDRADTMVALLFNVTRRPWSLAYSAASQDLYVADWNEDWVVAVDATSGAVLDTVELHGRADRLVWDPFRNLLYCTGGRWFEGKPLQVVDCITRTVVDVPGTDYTRDVALHPSGDRLYSLGVVPGGGKNVVRMVDPDSLVVTDSILLPLSDDWGTGGRLILHPSAGRLYACWLDKLTDGRGPASETQDTIVVLDLTSDSVLGLIGLPERYWQHSFAVNDSDLKLYLTALECESLVVIGPDDSIVAMVPLVDEYKAIGWNSLDNTIHVPYCDTMWIIDCSTDSIVHKEDYRGFDVRALRWNQLGSKLYMFDYGTIAVLDAGDTIAKRIPTWSHPWPLAYYPDLNKLYLHKSGRMGVLDCSIDSVVKILDFTPTLVWDGFVVPEMPKMYVPEGHSTAVFDLVSDSLVSLAGWERRHFVFNPNNGMVYAFRSDHGEPPLLVIDPVEDEVMKWINMPGRCVGVAMDVDRNLAYCLPEYGYNQVYVVNCSSDVVVDSMELPTSATYENLVMIDDVDKLYVFASRDVAVLDCETRTVRKTLGRGVASELDPGVFNQSSGKFWLRGPESVFVLDCYSDSVIAEFDAEVNNLALDSVSGRVYGGHEKVLYIFKDTLTGISEGGSDVPERAGRVLATVIRNHQSLSGGARAVLLDITGRKVMDLEPGLNDIRHIAPGVYFVRTAESGERSAVQKVVIQR